MNEAEGLRQRRPLRPQVITEDSPAQEAKEGRWVPGGAAGPRPGPAPGALPGRAPAGHGYRPRGAAGPGQRRAGLGVPGGAGRAGVCPGAGHRGRAERGRGLPAWLAPGTAGVGPAAPPVLLLLPGADGEEGLGQRLLTWSASLQERLLATTKIGPLFPSLLLSPLLFVFCQARNSGYPNVACTALLWV